MLDGIVRSRLRDSLRDDNIPEGPNEDVRINRRLYLPGPRLEGEPSYRIPDARVVSEGEVRDLSIGWKDASTKQFSDIREGTMSPKNPEGANVELMTPTTGPLKANEP